MAKSQNIATVERVADGCVFKLPGREGWAMTRLLVAGKHGCTPIDQPAPRWSHYIWKLRGHGFDIETVHEPHGGPFPGTHARYVLKTDVRILEREAS